MLRERAWLRWAGHSVDDVGALAFSRASSLQGFRFPFSFCRGPVWRHREQTRTGFCVRSGICRLIFSKAQKMQQLGMPLIMLKDLSNEKIETYGVTVRPACLCYQFLLTTVHCPDA